MFYEMNKILNEGQIGEFKLEKYKIEKGNLAAMMSRIPTGDYIKLNNKYDVIMSNTAMEMRTNRDFVHHANGDVLIAGLGIGLIILPIQNEEKIRSIIVLEKYPEVIELVGKQLPLNDKVKIIQGDVFEYEFPKGTKFDTIYFDIWNYVNSDIYEEMKLLKKKYRKYKKLTTINPNVYMVCWAEYEAKRNIRLY